MLYGLAVFDELASGMGSVSTPDIERSFGASHALATAMLFLVPGIVAFAIEPWLFVLADRHPRKWFIRGGVIAMAIAAVIAAFAHGPIALAGSQALLWCAIGSASSLAQATLVDRSDAPARTIARWTLLSLIGDVGAPALLAVLAIFGYGWRTGYAITAVVLAAWAVALVFVPIDGVGEEREVKAKLRDALRDRILLLWLFATSLCELLDEILIVLISIRVRDEYGASRTWQTATIVAFVAGNVIGLVAVQRIANELRALIVSAGCCALAYGAWLLAPNAAWSVVLIVPVGAFAGPLYPLASAQAYARSSSGLVLAAGHLFTPLSLALPFALGVVADRSILAALSIVLVAPVGLCMLAISQRKAR